MKIGEYEITPVYNAQAYFDLKERWGDDLVSLLFAGNKKGLEALADALSVMATQGELLRRLEGYEKRNIPSKAYIMLMLRPSEIGTAIEEAAAAIGKGMAREYEAEETDLGLLELQKKTVE